MRHARTKRTRGRSRAFACVLCVAIGAEFITNARAVSLFSTGRSSASDDRGSSKDLSALRDALREASEASRALTRAMDAASTIVGRLERAGGTATETNTRASADGGCAASERTTSDASSSVSARASYGGDGLDLEDLVRREAEARVRSALAGAAISSSNAKFGESLRRRWGTKVTTRVSVARALPFRRGKGNDRATEYYAVGDELGDVTVRSAETGATACETKTASASEVRSLVSYMSRLNTTVLVAGHDDGTVSFVDVVRTSSESGIDSDEHKLRCALVTSITIGRATTRYKEKFRAMNGLSKEEAVSGSVEKFEENVAVETLGMYRILGKRYVAAADANGRVAVFAPLNKDYAHVHGVFNTGSRVFAFMPYNKGVVALTQRGVTIANINTFTSKLLACDGLNHVQIALGSFDLRSNKRLTGLTTDGRVLSAFISLDGARTGCAFRVGGEQSETLLTATAIALVRGYAIVATKSGLEILNTTNTRVATRVFRTGSDVLLAAEGIEARSTEASAPVVASDGDHQIVVAHPDDGVIVMYDNSMYVAPPPTLFGENPWFQPLAMMITIGIAIWSYNSKRSETHSRDEIRRVTEDGLRKLGYCEDISRARARVTGQSLPGFEEWTPARLRREIEAAKLNGDI